MLNIKRLLSVSMFLVLIAITITALAEEIKISTIVPDQQIVRGKDAAIGSSYRKRTDADVDDGNIAIEGNAYVDGTLKVGTVSAPEGTMRYNDTTHAFEYHNGTEWVPLSSESPAYDSGWFHIDSSINQVITLDHNLGYIPTRIMGYAADSDNPTWVRPLPLQSGNTPFWAPEQLWFSNTQVWIYLASVDAVIGGGIPELPDDITPSQRGFLRILLWR